jgi:hypothetical protein
LIIKSFKNFTYFTERKRTKKSRAIFILYNFKRKIEQNLHLYFSFIIDYQKEVRERERESLFF